MLCPKPRPAAAPAPIASGFFSAPPISTPTTSVVVSLVPSESSESSKVGKSSKWRGCE